MELIRVPFTRFDDGYGRPPAYAHPQDAGADLAITSDLTLGPGQRAVVGTGIAMAIPEGYAGFVYPRSGLAARCGLSMVNSPGVIDAGYRGEVKLCLINTDTSVPIHLNAGDLVAQIVIQPVVRADFSQQASLPDTDRGAGGYGSTGGVAAWGDNGASTL